MNTISNFMIRNYKLLLVVIAISATFFAFTINQKPKSDPEKDKLLLELLQFVVNNYHYEH